MAEGGISLRECRRINQPEVNGDEVPMIDLKFERLQRTFKRGILRQWDNLLILYSLYENSRSTIASQIIEQVHNLLINFMNAEFESQASLLRRADDQYQLRIELDTELYHLTTAHTLGTNYVQEHVTESISTEAVVASVTRFLLKMESIRDRLSGTMQSMTVGMPQFEGEIYVDRKIRILPDVWTRTRPVDEYKPVLDQEKLDLLRDYGIVWGRKNAGGVTFPIADLNNAVTERNSYARKQLKKTFWQRQYLSNNDVGHLLGDSGYPLRTYLKIPVPHPSNPGEQAYNGHLCRGRIVVERAFGVLRSQLRCLHRIGGCLPFKPNKCCEIATVCVRLHNVCLELNVRLIQEEVGDVMDPEVPNNAPVHGTAGN